MIANYGDDSMFSIVSKEQREEIRRGAQLAREQDAKSQPLREILIRDGKNKRMIEVSVTNLYSRTDLNNFLEKQD